MPLIASGMQLAPDDLVLVEAAREFARAELAEVDRRCDADESSAVDMLPQLGAMGFLGLCIPEELGGLGCSYRLYAAILHEIAIHSPSVCVMLSVHNMVGNSLLKFPNEAIRKGPLAAWGDPENFSAFCLSEAGAGSDAQSTRTEAVEVEGGFRVTGEKMWITNGIHARWFLTLTRLRGAPKNKSLCALLIDGRSEGIERTKIRGKMGIRGSETAVIHLDNVFVPNENLIGEQGQGLTVFLASLNEGRISIAAQSTGIGEACLNEMIAYARQREQFGKPIGKFQAVGTMIADSAVELEAAKVLTWRAASNVDAGNPKRGESSMAKLYASESANRIAYRAVQVHGGTGYVNECRVERLYRDARVTTIYEGTSEVQRLVIARELS